MPHSLKEGKDILARHLDFALIGRDKEMSKLCSILVRQYSNSALLVGPSGVGASSLCLGLQAMKSNPHAPFDITSKSFFWLDVDSLFASGNLSVICDSFQSALDRMKRAADPVLIIEDSGDFIDACRNNGTNHFVNTLNGMVAKGMICVIMETNDKDLPKILAWHSDMREAYTILDIPEPAGQDLHDIAASVGEKLSTYHGISIQPEALEMAIELTQKYRQAGSGSAQPKRAIELLDQSLASYRLAAHSQPPKASALAKKRDSGNATPEDLAQYDALMEQHAKRQAQLRQFQTSQKNAEVEIAKLEEALLDERAAKKDATPQYGGPTSFSLNMGSSQEHEIMRHLDAFKAALVKHKEGYKALTLEINAELSLDKDAVVAEFARISGIPAAKLGEDEKAILHHLDTNLKATVFGQEEAITRISDAIKVSKVGRRNKEKPLASFLLAGPSGVGKTEIAKQIARLLQGDAKALTRFDMSEYMEKHAFAKLIGAPPGYEGFEAGGALTNAMRTNRNRILLFDEIEKAHPDVFNLFLQILDDGRLTDNVGRVAEFSDAIIIMTTNIGQPHFLDESLSHKEAMALCMRDLEATYKPEFLNRFNGRENIVGFKKLEVSSIERIVNREIKDMIDSYVSHGVNISMSQETISVFCQDRYNPIIGARGLPGFINANLESRIVNAIFDQTVDANSVLNITYDTDIENFKVVSVPKSL